MERKPTLTGRIFSECFSPEDVRQMISGSKKHFRVTARPQPPSDGSIPDEEYLPKYRPGDIIRVLEWWRHEVADKAATGKYLYEADCKPEDDACTTLEWCPSALMPCRAIRFNLLITKARQVRLKDDLGDDDLSLGIRTGKIKPEWRAEYNHLPNPLMHVCEFELMAAPNTDNNKAD